MKKPNKTVRLGAIALSAVLLGTGASLAAGDQSDPLVTLSYLNQTAIPQIVKQVEDKTALRQKELEAALADQIELYKRQAVQGGTVSGGSASYTLVSMSGGQVMSLEVGCEVLLRVGSVSMRAGGTVNAGPLTKNHLYMSTIEGRTLTASGEVKLLVRGSYSVT